MWVEFVVGSRPRCESFSPGSPVFLPPQKPKFPNSNSTWKQWKNSHSVDEPLIKFLFIFILFFYIYPYCSFYNVVNTDYIYVIIC